MDNSSIATTKSGSSSNHGRDWLWCVGANHELVLQLASDISYCSHFDVDSLNEDFQLTVAFSAEDAEVYQSYSRFLADIGFAQEERFKLAVAATIATNYLKPLPTRSWYFKAADNQLSNSFKHRQIIQLKAQVDGIYLVLSTEDEAATIMLLSKQHQVNNVKLIHQGTILKVHVDRFEPLDKPFQVSDL